ncbi:MAG TPA: peptidoglycan DD-metalloendopeptidase family protein [Ilumatobacter sp.]
MGSGTRHRVVVALAAMLVAAVPGLGADAQTDDDAAQRAAREIMAARERANQAADDYFAAESRLDVLQRDRAQLEIELGELAVLVTELEGAVERVAIARFQSSGATGIPILTDLREPTEQLQADVLASVVAESSATALDDYDEALSQVRDKQRRLAATEAAVERQQAELLRLQAEAEAEVERLRAVESQRLQDEAVAAVVAAQQREEQRQRLELERRQAEAAQAAAGGRTSGGSGTKPRSTGVGFIDGGIFCPVKGTSAYGDSWGAPRSGGRRHEGVDMLAPTGTPLQAVTDGFVTRRNNALGGITVSLAGDNGNRYYYAHLSGYQGSAGRVEAGAVIGYVGESGNATGTPHLHFEIRPGGGIPVNPYPSVRAAGC